MDGYGFSLGEITDALRLRIPAKPEEFSSHYTESETIYDMQACPNCDTEYKMTNQYNYCPHCGKCIDWEE